MFSLVLSKPTTSDYCVCPALPCRVSPFATKSYLDAKTQQLREDPRRSAWRDVVAKVPGANELPLDSDKSSLSEVMNVAWAVHELFRDGVGDMYDFFLQHYAGRRQ